MNIKNGTRIWFWHEDCYHSRYSCAIVTDEISSKLKAVKTQEDLDDLRYSLRESFRHLMESPLCPPYITGKMLADTMAWACGLQARDVTGEYGIRTWHHRGYECYIDVFFEFFLPEKNSH